MYDLPIRMRQYVARALFPGAISASQPLWISGTNLDKVCSSTRNLPAAGLLF